MNDKVYVPTYNSSNCAYIYNTDIIRVYDSVPRQNATINYKDYYIKSSYIYNTGSTSFTQYSTLPVCISSDRVTTDFWYRNDIMSIVFVSLALIFTGYFFVSKIVRTIFIDWRYS